MVDVRSSSIYSRHKHNYDVEYQIEKLSSKVKELVHTAILIRDEIKYQNTDLTKYQEIMNFTNNRIGQVHRRVTLLSQTDCWKIYLYLILFSLFVFLIIYSFIK